MKWRHYCDFCKKQGAAKHHIAKHEMHCCKNPNRVCGTCNLFELEQQPMAELVGVLDASGLDALKEFAQGCPACILAAICQHRQKLIDERVPPEDMPWYDFDFRAASKEALDRHNRETERFEYAEDGALPF